MKGQEVLRLRTWLALLILGTIVLPAAGEDGIWNSEEGGEWNSPANWLGGVPNAVGGIATFAEFPTADATITLESPNTIGALLSHNPFVISISSADPLVDSLTFNSGSLDPALIQLTGAQSRLRIGAPVILNDAGLITDTASAASSVRIARPISGGGKISKVGHGTLQLDGNNNAWTGKLEILQGVVEANVPFSLGDVATGTMIDGGTLRITQSASENIDLRSGLLVVAASMSGKIAVTDGQVNLSTPSNIFSSVEMAGGRLGVDQVTSVAVLGTLDVVHGGTATISGVGSSTLNLSGGGSGEGNLIVASDGTVNVLHQGVHYDGRLTLAGAGSLRINAPSSVTELVLDSKGLGQGALRGTGSLHVSDAIVVHKGRIAFEFGAEGLATDATIQKQGLTYSHFDNLGTGFQGDILVDAGSVRAFSVDLGSDRLCPD